MKRHLKNLPGILPGYLEDEYSFNFKYNEKDYVLKLITPASDSADESEPKAAGDADEISFEVQITQGSETANVGTITLNISFFANYVERLLNKFDEELAKHDWRTNNYGTENHLTKELVDLIALIFTPVVTTPLDEKDLESTPLKILNNANLTYSRGGEALADADKKAEWEKWNELLKSELLSQRISDNVWKGLINSSSNTAEYPTLTRIFATQFFTDPNFKLITVTLSGEKYSDVFSYLNTLPLLLWWNDPEEKKNCLS